MSTLTFTQHIDLDGETIAGSLTVQNTLTVTGNLHRAFKSLSAAGFDNLWTSGDGGLDTFDVLIIETTGPIWVELRNDHSGGAEFVLVEVTADNPLVLTSDNTGTSAATQVDGTAFADNTEYAQIDAVNVQNDGASAVTVKLTLID